MSDDDQSYEDRVTAARRKVEDALDEYTKARVGDDFNVVGYVVQLCTGSLHSLESNKYIRIIPDYQPAHSTLGLVKWLNRALRRMGRNG